MIGNVDVKQDVTALIVFDVHSCVLRTFQILIFLGLCVSEKVALCVMIDRIATADARLRPSRGLPPRPKAEQVRVLLASGTNVAVDRYLVDCSSFVKE